MATKTSTPTMTRVRCFCGNSIAVNPSSRKVVTCEKCHQPVPMKAVRMAIEARDQGISLSGSSRRSMVSSS